MAVYVSLAIPALVGAYQVVTKTGYHVSASFSRVRGTFDHPNPFAIYLTMLIIMGVALVLKVQRRSVKLLLLGAIGLSAALFLLLTYTRSAWIATLAGLLVVAFYQGKRLLPIMGFAVVLVVLLVPSVAERFSDLSTETTQSGAAGNSLVWRFEYWQQALELSENPIAGAGLRTVQASTDVSKEPHNDFIRVYVETGLIGLSAYLWFLVSLARSARRSIRHTRSPLEHSVAVGFAGCLAAFLHLEPGVERDQPARDPLVLPGVRGGGRGRTPPGTTADVLRSDVGRTLPRLVPTRRPLAGVALRRQRLQIGQPGLRLRHQRVVADLACRIPRLLEQLPRLPRPEITLARAWRT